MGGIGSEPFAGREAVLKELWKWACNGQSARTDVRGYGVGGSRRRESALKELWKWTCNGQSARTDVRGYGVGVAADVSRR